MEGRRGSKERSGRGEVVGRGRGGGGGCGGGGGEGRSVRGSLRITGEFKVVLNSSY